MLNQDLPCSHVIKSKAKELNSFYDIEAIERGVEGYQQPVRGVLTLSLSELPSKLSGDGTWIRSRLHVINLTFTLPNLPCAKSADGNVLSNFQRI